MKIFIIDASICVVMALFVWSIYRTVDQDPSKIETYSITTNMDCDDHKIETVSANVYKIDDVGNLTFMLNGRQTVSYPYGCWTKVEVKTANN